MPEPFHGSAGGLDGSMPRLSPSPEESPWPAAGFAHPSRGWEGPCLEEGNAMREQSASHGRRQLLGWLLAKFTLEAMMVSLDTLQG